MVRSNSSRRASRPNRFGVFLSLFTGYLLWHLAGYVRRLRRQPRAARHLAIRAPAAGSAVEDQAIAIARANIQSALEHRLLTNGRYKRVLPAGARHFREPWARDFGFSTYGLMAMDEHAAVRDGLEVFFHYQRASGQVPLKAHSTGVLERYLLALFDREQPVSEPLRPKYRTAHQTVALDGNALLVNAALHYGQQRENGNLIRRWWPALHQAMQWLGRFERGRDRLLRQGAYADWADSIARRGHIFYTNVLYWKAASEMARAAPRYGGSGHAMVYACLANRLKAKIQEHFWDDRLGYFVTSRRLRNLSSCGNLLAAAWGLATHAQAQRLLDRMDAFQMSHPIPTRVVNTSYPRRMIALENQLAGIPEYHTHAAWLWLGAWHVMALLRVGRPEKAKAVFRSISEVIVRDGVVHEVYGQDGRHLATRWYTSEAPLTWNAAMVVYAHQMLERGTVS